jgi:membrane fusion protein, adhesin transport system
MSKPLIDSVNSVHNKPNATTDTSNDLTPVKPQPVNMPVRAIDIPLVRDSHAALLSVKSPLAGTILLLMLAIVTTSIIWAHYAEVEEVTKGNAKVISGRGEQKVNSLEGGILTQLLVHEGDIVEAGQVLAKLDPTKANSAFQETDVRRIALKLSAVRLRAEAQGTALVFPSNLHGYKDIIQSETRAFEAKRNAVQQSVAALELNKKNVERELTMLRPLAKEGAVSIVEVMRLERQTGEIQAQVLDRVNKARADSNIELIKVESELSQLGENLKARVDIVQRTLIKSPVRASVKSIKHNTIGSVIPPSDTIVELVPLEESLLVEAKIRPNEVAFLHTDLPVTIKISAYDYSIYGALKGKIKFISPDTVKTEGRAQPDEEAYYRVLISTDTSTLESNGKKLEITPGMTASAEILTGKRSILEYLLKPIMKSKEALRER